MKVNDLKPVACNGMFRIQIGKDFLKTPMGNHIESSSIDLCARIKADFEGQGGIFVENGIVIKPRVLSAYVLASTKRDFMDFGGDLSGDLPGWLTNDPIFSPMSGHPIIAMYQSAQQRAASGFLVEHGLKLDVWKNYSADEERLLIGHFQDVVGKMSPSQKSALINMSWPNGGQFVATIMYLLGRCTSK